MDNDGEDDDDEDTKTFVIQRQTTSMRQGVRRGTRMSTSILYCIAAGACVSLSVSVTPAEYSAVVVVMESAEVHA